MDGETVAVKHPGAQSSEPGGQKCGDRADQEAVGEGMKKDTVLEQCIVPFQGEAFPLEAAFRFVEGKENEKKNRKIKKSEDHTGPGSAKPFYQSRTVGKAEETFATQRKGVGHQR